MKQNTFIIYTGDSKIMNLKAVYAENGDPLDLTNCTEIDVILPNADGTFAHRKLTDGAVAITIPKVLGKFTCTIPSDVSSLLNIGDLQNVDVTFTIDSKQITVRFVQSLTVFER